MITSLDDPAFWDNRYSENSANWDLKSPTPQFKSLIDENKLIYPSALLIPGCGKGYDAVYAAAKGYNVTAVDFSESAISYARNLADESGAAVEFLNDDLFELDLKEKFDFIFEYVTYCAINPARRPEFASKLASFLKPEGRLIALLFPIDGREGGPPFNINPIEAYKIFSAFLKLEYYSKNIESVKPRKGKEVLHIYKKVSAQ
jgi:methyl halide transferase